MSSRHQHRKKLKTAARDILGHGATMAQLDRLFRANMISVRIYDKLINPLLDQAEGRRKPGDPKKKTRSATLDSIA